MSCLLLEWSLLQVDSQSEFTCPKSTEGRLVLGAAVGGFVLPAFCSRLGDLEQPLNPSVPPFSDFCDDCQVMVPSSQKYGAGLINKLVMCFEIHWSDLSVCTIKALVPVLIYVQTDYSCLLTMSSQVCLLCFCLTCLSGQHFWWLHSSAAFAFSTALNRHIYSHLNSYGVSLAIQASFSMTK